MCILTVYFGKFALNAFTTIIVMTLDASEERPFENIVVKGENAGNHHFLLFLQCFLPYERQILCFE